MTEPQKIRSSYGCIHEHDILKIKNNEVFDVDINYLGDTITRKMVGAFIKEEYMLVDKITGTLYDPNTKECKSSTRLWIHEIRKTIPKKVKK
jgi:hypothetical protein